MEIYCISYTHNPQEEKTPSFLTQRPFLGGETAVTKDITLPSIDLKTKEHCLNSPSYLSPHLGNMSCGFKERNVAGSVIRNNPNPR